MKQILFVGDSLTWGSNPNKKGSRWPIGVRWTSRVAAAIKEREVVSWGLGGLALKDPNWTKENDWFSGRHRFIEKVILGFVPEVEDLFLFFGANDFDNKQEGYKEIAKNYQELINNIRERADGIKHIYIMLMPILPKKITGVYSFDQLNKEYRKIKNVDGFVDLSGIDVDTADRVHFDEEDSREAADIIIKFIKDQGNYK